MKKRIIGLMSGTSADGIDAALAEIDKQENFSIKLLHHAHIPWSPIISDEIIFACKANAPVQRIVALNSLLGEHFAKAAMQVALDSSIPLTEIDAIASHGQTICISRNLLKLAVRRQKALYRSASLRLSRRERVAR